MAKYFIIHNRSEYPLAETNDLTDAGLIIHALMTTRNAPMSDGTYWDDYWVKDENGNEYYYDENYRCIFSAACF